MLELRPYSDLDAHAVLCRLDPADQAELELTRGAPTLPLAAFADWRAVASASAVSLVALWRAQPFAVFALLPAGTAGIGQGALLAANHRRYRHALGRLAARIRAEMPAQCRGLGLRRVEARCWAGHPTAMHLLTALSFRFETLMPGYGPDGTATFAQFAWVDPDCLAPTANIEE